MVDKDNYSSLDVFLLLKLPDIYSMFLQLQSFSWTWCNWEVSDMLLWSNSFLYLMCGLCNKSEVSCWFTCVIWGICLENNKPGVVRSLFNYCFLRKQLLSHKALLIFVTLVLIDAAKQEQITFLCNIPVHYRRAGDILPRRIFTQKVEVGQPNLY